jgi:hypothetical protein
MYLALREGTDRTNEITILVSKHWKKECETVAKEE